MRSLAQGKSMKIQKIFVVLLAFLLILFGCTKPSDDNGGKKDDWATANGLYEDEAMDVLYEKAKQEGSLVIYTISSRTQKVANAFMEDYPGINVEVKDISASELKTQYQTEYESGVRNVDILHSKEVTGDYIAEVFPEKILHNYRPDSIFKNTTTYKDYTPLLMELNIWFYNTEVYDTCPFTSWWALTTEEWTGKVVFQDPVSNVAYAGCLTAMLDHADEMAADYKEYFGKEIELAADEPNAAYAFIKRFLANKPIIAKGSDEVIELVGAKGQTNPPVGYASSVKLRKAQESGYAVGATPETMKVSTGIPALNFIAIADECPHPNAAKLFIKYWLGGEDGQGRGYSFLVSAGTWAVRPENPTAKENVDLSEIKLWEPDFNSIYKNIGDVTDYWTKYRN